jgi:hypothetical protein
MGKDDKKKTGEIVTTPAKPDPNERFELQTNFKSKGMIFRSGTQLTRAFLERRGVDIDNHLERKLIAKV